MRRAKADPPSSNTEQALIVCADHSIHWMPADQLPEYLRGTLYGMVLAAAVGVAILFWLAF